MIGSGWPIEAGVFLSFFRGPCNPDPFRLDITLLPLCRISRRLISRAVSFSEDSHRAEDDCKLPSRLVDEVYSRPVISISKMSREWGVSFSAVQMGMDRLVQIGILRQVTDRKRNRLFVASNLLDVLSRPTSCN